MIFNVPGHIDMIRNGLRTHLPLPAHILPKFYVKTQTRRVNRGIYQVGRDYAVQQKRGVKAETDIRIVMDRIREEAIAEFHHDDSTIYPISISKEDAWAEGGYTPEQFEERYQEFKSKGNRFRRIVFEFHVIEV